MIQVKMNRRMIANLKMKWNKLILKVRSQEGKSLKYQDKIKVALDNHKIEIVSKTQQRYRSNKKEKFRTSP